MYCDTSPTVVVWGTEDPIYRTLTDKHPWMLDRSEQISVEEAMGPCHCGGRFGFNNPPRCPHCLADITSLVPDRIYFLESGDLLGAKSQSAWTRMR